MTQKELSVKLNESQSYVSKYESGEQRLAFDEVERVCNALAISLSDFIRVYNETKSKIH